MSELAIGTATFMPAYGLGADAPSVDSAAGLLREAFAAGIRYVDTAAGYGEAERIVGAASREVRDYRVRVCTKLSARPETLAAEARASLARLGLDSVDTVLLHSVGAASLGSKEVAAALIDLQAQGLARLTGASTYGVADATAVLQRPWCSALQVEHSLLNPSVVRSLSARSRAVEIIVRSVLCKGLLTSRRGHAPALVRALGATLDGLERVAAEWGWALEELAIRYALDTEGVDIVVVGISNEAELRVALSAAGREPLDAPMRASLAAFERPDSDAAHPERWQQLSPEA